MPCLEISMPKTDEDTRARLATRLTDAFAESTPFDADIFGIRFHEYEYGKAASGGKICDYSDQRPYLHMLLYIPRISRTAKQSIVDTFTKAFTETLGMPEWKPVIHICEHPYDNVGVMGGLLSDMFDECAGKEFYYDLPKD